MCRAAQHVSPRRPRRLRTEFDNFQRTFCQAFCEPLPPIPRPRKASSLASYPLPDITKMNGLTGNELPSSDSDTDDDSTHPTRPPRNFTTKARWSARPRHSRNRSHISASVAAATTYAAALQHSAGEGSGATAEHGGSGRGGGRGGAAAIPWGGIYLKLVLLEAKTLKSVFDVSRVSVAHEAAAAMEDVLQPWQAAAGGDGQLGCLFVTVRRPLAHFPSPPTLSPPPPRSNTRDDATPACVAAIPAQASSCLPHCMLSCTSLPFPSQCAPAAWSARARA